MRKRIVRSLLPLMLAMAAAVPVNAQSGCEAHDYQWVEEAATCMEMGWSGYVCIGCGQLTEMTLLPQLEHTFQAWETVRVTSCSEEGLEQRICTGCGLVQERSVEKLAHTETLRVYEPTCGRDGYTLHACSVCGYEERTDTVEKLGHNYIVTVIAPTCTADGYTRHKCANCGDAYRTDHMEKTGHLYDGGVETKEPTLTTMGRITYTCQYCGDTYLNTIPKWIDPFEDLDKKGYYYTPVLWAYNSGITSGTDNTHFSPDGLCSRAQVVTFLWREAGEPEPEESQCPFVDVPPGSYYEKAVLWAVERGITNGTDAVHFSPDASCTRGQVVTFLFRAKGSPETDSGVSFSDVKTGDYFFDAVCWAYENGVTTGTGGSSFSPNQACTRAQVVTFLYRAREFAQR